MLEHQKNYLKCYKIINHAISGGWKGHRNVLWNVGEEIKNGLFFSNDSTFKDAKENLKYCSKFHKDKYLTLIPVFNVNELEGVILNVDFLKAFFGKQMNEYQTDTQIGYPEGNPHIWESEWRHQAKEMIIMTFQERIDFLDEYLEDNSIIDNKDLLKTE